MAYIGLFGGLTIGILGWFFGRLQAKKNNGLDEMNSYIYTKARSISWYFTTVTIYILFSLALFDVTLSLILALAILLFVHLGSWGISAIILSTKLTIDSENVNEVFKYRMILSITIGASCIVFFTIMSIVTGNWMFLVVAIPPALLSTLTTIYAPRKKTQ